MGERTENGVLSLKSVGSNNLKGMEDLKNATIDTAGMIGNTMVDKNVKAEEKTFKAVREGLKQRHNLVSNKESNEPTKTQTREVDKDRDDGMQI